MRSRPHSIFGKPWFPARAFTLLELIVTMAILGVIVMLASRVIGGASDAWLRVRANVSAFKSANVAFDVLSQNFAQAVLSTYWSYDPPEAPTRFRRTSDLHFTMGPAGAILASGSSGFTTSAAFFQAPLGYEEGIRRLPELLNGVGYFIRFDAGQEVPAFLQGVVPPRWRYRLYEWIEPSAEMEIYKSASPAGANAWITDRLFASGSAGALNNAVVLAENIIGLIFMAEYPDSAGGFTPSYVYDSRDAASASTENQLPPRVHVTMIAMDETSALRLSETYGTKAPPVLPDADWFKDPSEFKEDMGRWEEKLKQVKPTIHYTIFNATLTMENSRWSP